MYFYTSDTHAYHGNIIKHSDRPFADAEAMSQVMADNINLRVGRQDWLYHLGDWSFGPRRDADLQLRNAKTFREMVNCRNVVLLFGNHDHLRGNEEFRRLFTKTGDLMEVRDNVVGEKIILCHYALRVWNASHHGRWHLYGHSHGNLPDPDTFSFDVGVDCHNYSPINSHDVAKIMQQKWDRGVRPSLHHEVKEAVRHAKQIQS